MKSTTVSLGLGWVIGLFVATFTGVATAVAYGGGLQGAQNLREGEKAACELFGWAMGAVLGSYVAAKLRSGLAPKLALFLGLALYVGNGVYFMGMPMPPSFWVLGGLLSAGGSLAGAALGSRANARGSGA